ncbi:EAL domain-containing protein [Aeromonas sp. HMWF016]|uniref:EAL domain-containing protein n=1 Tax=Aeromonas sp. HMWF016 TaxID=2056852 RepID=UPI000D3A035F|nr:EAL domain-containing protein [Aeromonas sp. HMWF016]PTT44472.1 hypothetical protein DBR09_19180 [Aeromonas sp. HMWF016]
MSFFLSLSLFFIGLCCHFVYYIQSPDPEQKKLRRALTDGEFVAFLQPIVGQSGSLVTGCEVLVRWLHPTKGLVQPDHFIPLAEKSGLVVPMTQALMREVLRHFSPIAHKLPSGFHFGFNITASHFHDLTLVDDCRAFLAGFTDRPVTLVLEVTERELLTPDEVTCRLFTELKELGVVIALDDFGTGHANLAYLQEFDIDIIKLDKRFVMQVGSEKMSTHIVDNVLDLASRLELKVVAEGVENSVQRDLLEARGIDFMQGYLFGKPVPMENFWKVYGNNRISDHGDSIHP